MNNKDKQKHLDWLAEREAERERLAKIERKEYEDKLAEKILLSLLSNEKVMYIPNSHLLSTTDVANCAIKLSKSIASKWMNDKDTDD